jgi:hypothetical protein
MINELLKKEFDNKCYREELEIKIDADKIKLEDYFMIMFQEHKI